MNVGCVGRGFAACDGGLLADMLYLVGIADDLGGVRYMAKFIVQITVWSVSDCGGYMA